MKIIHYLHYYLVQIFHKLKFYQELLLLQGASFIQSTNRVVLEAGLDDTTGFESAYDTRISLY
jgi:hypothetical protein